MSAITIEGGSHPLWRHAVMFAWQTWRAMTARRWAALLAIGLVMTLVSLPHRLEMIQRVGWFSLPMVVEITTPLFVSAIMFLGWTLADAGHDGWCSRSRRVVYALLGASAVATVAGFGVWHLSGADEILAQYLAAKGKAPPSAALVFLAEFVNLLTVGGLIYAVAEVTQKRRRTQLEFEAAVGRRVALEHEVLESRLLAMQAQVEPRFLFDALVDVEALYEKNPQRAAANLDRLITYLRAALPRLRETGSTVEAELELVKAYLEVVTAVHGGRPTLTATLADECRTSRFYPMLLLPLIQRAVRHPSGALPETITIDVRRQPGHTVIALRIALAGGCADDPELARVRERLAGLYGDAAKLQCVEVGGEFTELTLRIPADGAAALR